jgi:hypothetical protein
MIDSQHPVNPTQHQILDTPSAKNPPRNTLPPPLSTPPTSHRNRCTAEREPHYRQLKRKVNKKRKLFNERNTLRSTMLLSVVRSTTKLAAAGIVLETRVLADEGHSHHSRRTVTMLADDQLRSALVG